MPAKVHFKPSFWAGLLIVIGGIWLAQGTGVLPGSFMTGQTRWAVIGGTMVVAGLAILVLARRRT